MESRRDKKKIHFSKIPPGHYAKRRPFNRRLRFWVILLIAILILVPGLRYLFSFVKKNHAHPAPVVMVSSAKTEDVPVYLVGLGTVTPTYTVTVKTQINGLLLRVPFREGQMVKAGDLLAEIDPRPYEAQLVQYEGQLERDSALLDNAKLDLQRYKTLWSQNSVAKQVYDTQDALVRQDEGTVRIDQGLIQSTKVNLIYTKITSPVDGRVGLRLVDPGNFVQTSDTTGIAVIATMSPITVIFTLPEDSIPDVAKQVFANKKLTVQAYDRAQIHLLDTGFLLTIDNEIDPTTGTVKLKAQFPNAHNQLFPNQFVNAKLLINTLKNAIVVPTAAIQQSTNGPYVYILNEDHTVKMTPVQVGVVYQEDTAITSGVSAGEKLVTQGADKLEDGMKVTLGKSKTTTTTSQKTLASLSRLIWPKMT